MDNQIGEEFKRIRKERKMTLRELSDQSGLSVSFLSQVERGISTVTFTSLRKIAEALGVSVNFFFEHEEESPIKKRSLKKSADQPNFTYTSLMGDLDQPKFTPARIELKAGESHTAPYSHQGEEFVYVLEGELKVTLEGYEETLYPHESLHIDSTKAHTWYNETDKPVVLLVVSTNVND
ncbi:helix-turn-helix domain-containing protein [Bhargavaea massiliensis]|uniref:helix-turn-helix domain-containing protein n=1 Tax=Bhargavaea massiliensis TaxID=2697500 RepID=UPI001BCB4B24|nr:XRE family transcriptional regulator [Bhargavaea massiliensis]